jgi:hypothetical protein
MLEFLKLFAEHQKTLVELPQALENWAKFLTFLRAKLDRVDERLDAIDSKLQVMIDGPPTITPRMHEDVIKWSRDDPRQIEIRREERNWNG